MASILKARVDDKESAARVISLPSDHPWNLAPTIGLQESPVRTDLVEIIEADFAPKKSEYVLFVIVEGTCYRHIVTGTV